MMGKEDLQQHDVNLICEDNAAEEIAGVIQRLKPLKNLVDGFVISTSRNLPDNSRGAFIPCGVGGGEMLFVFNKDKIKKDSPKELLRLIMTIAHECQHICQWKNVLELAKGYDIKAKHQKEIADSFAVGPVKPVNRNYKSLDIIKDGLLGNLLNIIALDLFKDKNKYDFDPRLDKLIDELIKSDAETDDALGANFYNHSKHELAAYKYQLCFLRDFIKDVRDDKGKIIDLSHKESNPILKVLIPYLKKLEPADVKGLLDDFNNEQYQKVDKERANVLNQYAICPTNKLVQFIERINKARLKGILKNEDEHLDGWIADVIELYSKRLYDSKDAYGYSPARFFCKKKLSDTERVEEELFLPEYLYVYFSYTKNKSGLKILEQVISRSNKYKSPTNLAKNYEMIMSQFPNKEKFRDGRVDN